ncbi:hypothetical protein PR048_022260 [Dryococelus australis]|uniref:Uncharacterized protein n=1 Tax=Dryococelus australis TaxID=614101 RepID=A0ABQ9H0J2_9NEOP|nr:hypothetical protein PR048_022260 [Dryococelus australis]
MRLCGSPDAAQASRSIRYSHRPACNPTRSSGGVHYYRTQSSATPSNDWETLHAVRLRAPPTCRSVGTKHIATHSPLRSAHTSEWKKRTKLLYDSDGGGKMKRLEPQVRRGPWFYCLLRLSEECSRSLTSFSQRDSGALNLPDGRPETINIATGLRDASCAGRFDYSPPALANRARFSAGSLSDFRTWESCRTPPLVGGFPRGSLPSPPPAFAFRRCSLYPPHCTLIGSRDPGRRLSLVTRDAIVRWARRRCRDVSMLSLTHLIPACENPVTGPGNWARFALVGGERVNRSATVAPCEILIRHPRPGHRIFASAGRCSCSAGFLGDLPFTRPFIPTPLHIHFNHLIGSQDLARRYGMKAELQQGFRNVGSNNEWTITVLSVLTTL